MGCGGQKAPPAPPTPTVGVAVVESSDVPVVKSYVGALDGYPALISKHLAPEITAGRRLLTVFSRHRHLIHAAMATPLGWRAFEGFCQGELTMAGVLRRAPLRVAINLLGGEPPHPA